VENKVLVKEISFANFVKISFFTSGVCLDDNCIEDNVTVPYGTNLNGQTICYTTEKNSVFSRSDSSSGFDSCAAQLTQVILFQLHKYKLTVLLKA